MPDAEQTNMPLQRFRGTGRALDGFTLAAGQAIKHSFHDAVAPVRTSRAAARTSGMTSSMSESVVR